MSYDDVSVLADFAAEQGIGYPLLSDKGGGHARRFGILNDEYDEGHFAHGVPHPGVFFVDPTGTIRLKRAVPGYRDRPPLDELLSALSDLLAEAPAETTAPPAEE